MPVCLWKPRLQPPSLTKMRFFSCNLNILVSIVDGVRWCVLGYTCKIHACCASALRMCFVAPFTLEGAFHYWPLVLITLGECEASVSRSFWHNIHWIMDKWVPEVNTKKIELSKRHYCCRSTNICSRNGQVSFLTDTSNVSIDQDTTRLFCLLKEFLFQERKGIWTPNAEEKVQCIDKDRRIFGIVQILFPTLTCDIKRNNLGKVETAHTVHMFIISDTW